MTYNRQPAVNAERIRLAVALLRAVRVDLGLDGKERIAVETILDLERLGIDLDLEAGSTYAH
jgi:hypothetical protein